jgi:hypothetical protein
MIISSIPLIGLLWIIPSLIIGLIVGAIEILLVLVGGYSVYTNAVSPMNYVGLLEVLGGVLVAIGSALYLIPLIGLFLGLLPSFIGTWLMIFPSWIGQVVYQLMS